MIPLRECLGSPLSRRQNVKPIIDLFAHVARCESNFSRLAKLLRTATRAEFQSRTVKFPNESAPVRFECSRMSKYTSAVLVVQETSDEFTNLSLKIHVYHDTRSAEVVSYQRHYDFHVLDTKPKPPRTQRFEKIEMNRFLSELLDHCITFGIPKPGELTPNKEQGSSISS